jgi:hypothetical protein
MDFKRNILLSLAAVGLAVVLLFFTHRPPVPPKEATMEDVRAEAGSGGYRLLTTAELAELYRQGPSKLLLVDTREDWEYRSGHIKGAVNFPLEPTWWGRWRARGKLRTLLGPDKDRLVVFYGAGLT